MPFKKRISQNSTTVVLKDVARHVGLAAGTVSSVLNDAPQSRSIPQATKDRIFAAARELNYQPNPFAQALRSKRAVPLPQQTFGNGSGALMFIGAEHLVRAIHAMRQAGLRIPDDVSVVGMDQFPGVAAGPIAVGQ
jgi:DNA-binding LacI/PurR family transcriptional regulator